MRTVFTLGLAGLLAATPAVCADRIQAGPAYTAQNKSDKVPAFPEVQIVVEVQRPGSNEKKVPSQLLSNKDNYSLKVDGGAPVAASGVQTIKGAQHGMAVAVTLDLSGSMTGKPLQALRDGLVKFVDQAAEQDKVAIQTVADDARWEADWDFNREQMKAVLGKVESRGSLTRLWDGLLISIDHFPATPVARRLIVISDGHDEGSKHTLAEVIAAARKARLHIDSIGMTRTNPIYLGTLSKLSAETGGLYRTARSLPELQKWVGEGIDALHELPVVTFTAANVERDGKQHDFQVTWKGGPAEAISAIPVEVPSAAPGAAQETNNQQSPPTPIGTSTTQNWTEKITREMWIGGGVLLALLLGLGVWLLMKRKKSQPAPQAPAPSPIAFPGPGGGGGMGAMNTPDPTPWLPHPPRTEEQPIPAPGLGLRPREFTPPPISPDPFHFNEPAGTPLPPRVNTVIAATFHEPVKGRPTAWLVCEEGPDSGKAFPVDDAAFWIGANENNHVRLIEDDTVSGNHACILYEDHVLGIYDYQSTNGTKVNDQVVTEHRRLLRPGDRIKVGKSTFALQRVERSE